MQKVKAIIIDNSEKYQQLSHQILQNIISDNYDTNLVKMY